MAEIQNYGYVDWDLDIVVAAIEALGEDDGTLPQNNSSDEFDDTSSLPTRYPGPEWIYPDGNASAMLLQDHDDDDADVPAGDSNSYDDQDGFDQLTEHEHTPIPNTTESSQTNLTKHYSFKISGFTIYDDNFAYALNPKVYLLMSGIIILAAFTGDALIRNAKRGDTEAVPLSNTLNIITPSPSMSPSLTPSNIN